MPAMTPSNRPGALTVATYNAYLGADLALLFAASTLDELAHRATLVQEQLAATDFPQRARALARVLVRAGVDVVGLQELSRWGSAPILPDGALGPDDPLVEFLPLLLAALEAEGAPYDVHAVNENFAGGLPVEDRWMSIVGANAVLVRRDGPFTVTAERTGTFEAALEMPTGIDGVTFPILRSWGAVDGSVSGRPVRFVVTHTEAYDPVPRDAQRDELVAAIGDPGCPVVVVGDFNAQPHAVGMPAPYVDAWTAAGNDPEGGFTCGQGAVLDNPESRLGERIDYVFVRDAEVLDCRVVGDQPGDRSRPDGLWPSDHAGVVARLQFEL
jgi:endonuclease/exonuclease/phosphatase family metal-dependent hydrolase